MLLGKGIGSVMSGPMTVLLSRGRDKSLWRFSALMLSLSAPLGWAMVSAPDALIAGACAMLIGVALGVWSGQAMTIVLASSHPSARGVSVGAYQLSVNLLGSGLGPLATGFLSDQFGEGGLGAAIGWTLTINLLSAVGFLAACICLPKVSPGDGTPETAH